MCPLLGNTPEINLNPENDYLDLIKKGNAIKYFFDQYPQSLNKLKIFALYGEWGSGKTTLMHYLKSKLSTEYNIIIFEAWKYEKDGNLALSLIDFLLNSSESIIQEHFKDLGIYAAKFLVGMAKGITFNLPGVSFQSNNFFEEIEKPDKKDLFLKNSQFRIQKDFEKLFLDFEKRISNGKKNLIFIDDLDRCEPENVLNLLSAIKLFFTFGENTIYLAGIDKDAVKKAVFVKYNDIVKSEEYLEKVFDYSFYMPNEFNLYKLLKLYFTEKNTPEIENKNHIEILNGFFESIKFTNPRRVKKILNKYEVVRQFKSTKLKSISSHTIPNILSNKEGSVTETIFTLFFIILYEFYYDSYLDIKNFDNKIRIMIEHFQELNKNRKSPISIEEARGKVKCLHSSNLWENNFKSYGEEININTTDEDVKNKIIGLKKEFLYLFMPSDITIVPDTSILEFHDQIESSKHELLKQFVKYINQNFFLFRCPRRTNYKFRNFFNFCETWL